jgi:hypothetical protein
MAQVFAILSLIAQVYGSKPQKGNEESWPEYIFLVASFIVICIAGILYMLRKHVALHGKALVGKLNGFARVMRLGLRNSTMADWLMKCFYWVWYYSGLAFLYGILKRRFRREDPGLPI